MPSRKKKPRQPPRLFPLLRRSSAALLLFDKNLLAVCCTGVLCGVRCNRRQRSDRTGFPISFCCLSIGRVCFHRTIREVINDKRPTMTVRFVVNAFYVISFDYAKISVLKYQLVNARVAFVGRLGSLCHRNRRTHADYHRGTEQ